MSTLSVATIKSASSAAPVIQNSSGTEKGQFTKAWVNFNGTGTVAIRDSFNVSSITDDATGQYTINLTTAMANTNYCAVQYNNESSGMALANFDNQYAGGFLLGTGTVKVNSYHTGNVDSALYCVAIFGAN